MGVTASHSITATRTATELLRFITESGLFFKKYSCAIAVIQYVAVQS